jgi:sulfur carrier protein ThiS
MYRTFEGGSVTETLTPEEAEEQGLVLNGEIVEERKKKAELGQSVNYLFDSSMTPAEQLINENSFKEERFIVVVNGVPTFRSFLVR